MHLRYTKLPHTERPQMKLRSLIVHSLRTVSQSIKKNMAAIQETKATSFHETAPPTYAMYENLKDLCHNNMEYFKVDDSESGQRLHGGFQSLATNIEVVLPLVDHVRKVGFPIFHILWYVDAVYIWICVFWRLCICTTLTKRLRGTVIAVSCSSSTPAFSIVWNWAGRCA